MPTEGEKVAIQDDGLPFELVKNALSWMRRLVCGAGVARFFTRIGPVFLDRFVHGDLLFEPCKAAEDECEAILNCGRAFPVRFAFERGKRGDALSDAPQIGDEGCCKARERRLAWPGFRKKAFEGIFGVVVGKTGGASSFGELAGIALGSLPALNKQREIAAICA